MKNISTEYKIYEFFVINKIMEEIKQLEEERNSVLSVNVAEINLNNKIKEIDIKIDNKQKELERIKNKGITVNALELINGTLISKEERENIILKMQQKEEEKRKQTYEQIKKLYKTTEGHEFQKFKNSISGKTPKWRRKIAKLSLKELEYLLATFNGDTLFTNGEKRYVEGLEEMPEYQKEKIVANNNWRLFLLLLNKTDLLKKHLSIEERHGYHGKK